MKHALTPEQLKGQDGKCETVLVKADNEDGYAAINKHDLTEEHELFKGKVATKPKDVDFASMKVADLKAHLDAKEVDYGDAKKDELVALCVANP